MISHVFSKGETDFVSRILNGCNFKNITCIDNVFYFSSSFFFFLSRRSKKAFFMTIPFLDCSCIKIREDYISLTPSLFSSYNFNIKVATSSSAMKYSLLSLALGRLHKVTPHPLLFPLSLSPWFLKLFTKRIPKTENCVVAR